MPLLLPTLAALLGVALFSVMDAAMKRASIAGGVYNALLFRNIIGAALMWPLWRLSGGHWPGRANLRVHLLRSAVVAGMAGLFFWGLVRVPMAEAIALSFFAPIIAIYLASLLLGEHVRAGALAASGLGLAGVLVIAGGRFGQGTMDAETARGMIAVLGSAVLYAVNLVIQRKQAQLASPQEIALFQNLCAGGIFALAAPWLAVLPQPEVLADIALSAVLAAAALMLLAWAYARAEAQSLVATEYSAFIWAALMGWLWFDEALTWPVAAGAALIVAACWIAAPRAVAQAPVRPDPGP
ncbi:MAG TPA: DMT family transporter [Novosphingobium sp.]|nr:DMT family transporter [Novosphingobium sp.]